MTRDKNLSAPLSINYQYQMGGYPYVTYSLNEEALDDIFSQPNLKIDFLDTLDKIVKLMHEYQPRSVLEQDILRLKKCIANQNQKQKSTTTDINTKKETPQHIEYNLNPCEENNKAETTDDDEYYSGVHYTQR